MTGRKTKMYEGTLNSSTFLFYCFRQESVLQLLSPMKGLFFPESCEVCNCLGYCISID